MVAVGVDVDVDDHDEVLFHLGANCDPGRDLHRRDHRIGLDATQKVPGDERRGEAVRPFPPIIEMDDVVKAAVTARAAEFGL